MLVSSTSPMGTFIREPGRVIRSTLWAAGVGTQEQQALVPTPKGATTLRTHLSHALEQRVRLLRTQPGSGIFCPKPKFSYP